MNNFKKFKSGAGQAMESNDGASEALSNHLWLCEELEKSRGQVKDLSKKLKKTMRELELTASKADLEERLRVSNYLVEEVQLLNERLESEKSKLVSKLTLAHVSGPNNRLTASKTSGSHKSKSGARQAMESNRKANKARMEKIFGNPLILRLILEQIPNSNLLKLSLVNKFWKKEARVVMKKRGMHFMALLRADDGASGCGQVLQDFARNLETLNETLYSGMTIWLRPNVVCKGTGALEVERIYESIVVVMRGQLKRLSIQLEGPKRCWANSEYCPNFLLLQLLLRDFIRNLEHLTLQTQGKKDIMEQFIQEFLPPGPYPKLKVLKLKDVYRKLNQETFQNIIRTLFSQAPNLQEIHTLGHVSLRENLMEGREGVVHVHEADMFNPITMEDIPEIAIPALKLKWFKLFYNTEPELTLDRFNEKAQRLLRTCCATTLEELKLDTVSLVLFMSYRIPLVNVKTLSINFDYVEVEQLEPEILIMLRSRFDFNYLFPNLENVYILSDSDDSYRDLSRDTMDAIIEKAGAIPIQLTLPRAGNIKGLYLSGDLSPSSVKFFTRMFPAIQHLSLNGHQTDVLLPPIWERCPQLRSIYLGRKQIRRP